MWDQQSYNQTHEPVWASKEIKQPTSNHISFMLNLKPSCFNLDFSPIPQIEQRYSYGKTSSTSTGGGASSSRNATPKSGKESASGSGGSATATASGAARGAPPPPPGPPGTGAAAGRGGKSNTSERKLEHQYTGQFSMFVDEGQFPSWDD